MKAPEMRDMTMDELEVHHDEIVEELVNLRIKLSMRQLDNPLRVRELRREVARAKSILRDKRMGAQPGEAGSASKKS